MDECPICYLPKSLDTLPCGHKICGGCIRCILKKVCPFCRRRYLGESKDELFEMEMSYEEVLQAHLDSIMAELNAAAKLLEEIRRRKREKRLKKMRYKMEKKKRFNSDFPKSYS